MIGVVAAIFAAITFPGVIVRECTHLALVRLEKLAIFEVRFLQLKPPFGYVQYEKTERYTAALFCTLGPFLLNSALCVAFCVAAFLPVWLKMWDPLSWLFYWLGLSLGVHAFPERDELAHLWKLTQAAVRRGNVLATLALPLLLPMMLIQRGRTLWADGAYGIALGLVTPLALARLVL